MSLKVFGEGNRIGRRLMLLIIAFSSLITLVLTAVQLVLDYRQQRGDIDRMLDEVAVQLPTLSGVVWAFNETQIELSLEAMIRLPNIERAEVATIDGIGRWSRGSKATSSHVIKRAYSLHRMVRGQEREIAQLEVVASLDAVYRRVFEHALSILLSNAVKTFLVAAFMLTIFNRLVTRRVVALAEEVGKLAPRLLSDLPADQAPNEQPVGVDELDSVHRAFDIMAAQLEAALRALKQHTDHLEDTVRERTADVEREKRNLAQALGELQRILEHASLGICLVVRQAGQRPVFQRVNQAFEHIFGCASGGLDGADTSILFPDADDIDWLSAAYSDTIQQGRSFHEEIVHRRADGQTVVVEVVGTAVDPDDLAKGTIWLVNDITQRRAAERALGAAKEEAETGLVNLSRAHAELNETLAKLRATQAELVEREKMAALGSLVAGVAHELNTPIGNSLTVASTLFDETSTLAERLKEGIKRSTLETYVEVATSATDLIVRNLHRAADLVISFKQVAVDQTSSQRRCFKLNSLIAEIVTMLRSSIRKASYVVEYALADEIEMDSYPGPLGQVISNLVNNAIVHGFDGRAEGTVRIEAFVVGADWVKIVVADDGVGISKENQRHIFEPFFTTKLGQGGSGLGLNIVRTIVTGMMGGRIMVDSEPGRGTTFALLLPARAPADATQALADPSAAAT